MRRATIKDLYNKLEDICLNLNQDPKYFYNKSTATEDSTMKILESDTLKHLNLPGVTGARP
jgi:hypothetical protein